MKWPIEQEGEWWCVWSLPVEHTISRSSAGLETFESYAAGSAECSRRNLAHVERLGIADQQMPALDGGKGGLSPYTYREFYMSTLQRAGA